MMAAAVTTQANENANAMVNRISPFIGLCLMFCLVVGSEAAEFRSKNTIMTPTTLPAGARRVAQFMPVDRALVEKAVKRLFNACCTDIAALDGLIADNFVNKSRVLDNFVERFPRDGKLILLGMQGVQTLNQHIETDPEGGGEVLVSTVSVIARSEIQFNDPQTGFTRLPGTVDYIFRFEQKIR